MDILTRKFFFVFFLGIGLSFISFRLVQGAELFPSLAEHASSESLKGHDDSQKQTDSSVAPASIPDFGEGQHALENNTPTGEFVSPHSGSISGTVPIDFRVQKASAVEFFLEQPGLHTSFYIGQGVASSSNDWTFSWDTVNTPNGLYKLFCKITNVHGDYESQHVVIIVQNKTVELEQKVAQAQQKIAEVDKHVEGITKQTTQVIVQTIASPPAMTPSSSSTQSPSPTTPLPVPAAVQKKLDQQVQDFADSVQQSNDIAQKLAQQQVKQNTLDQKIQTEQKAIQDAEKKHLDVVVPEKQKVIESLQNEKEAMQKEIQNNQQSLQAVQQAIAQKKEEVVATVQQSKGIEKPLASSVQADVSQKMDTLATNISSVQPEKQQAQSVLSAVSSSSVIPPPASSTPPPPTQQNAPAVNPGAYQDPHSIAPLHADEYSVDHVALVRKPNITKPVLELEGKGQPDTFVTVTVFSNPLVFTTKTDSTGRWHYTLDAPLSEGTHEVFVTVANNQGALAARSEGFFFAKTANAVAAISEGLGQEQSSEFVSSLQGQSTIFIFVIIGLGVILGLGLVGMAQRKNV